MKLGFKNKILNIPNSIKIPQFKIKLKKIIKKITIFKQIASKKGLVELLNAWKKIQNTPRLGIVNLWFNENNYKKEILNKIKNLNLQRVFKRFVTGKQKKNLLFK